MARPIQSQNVEPVDQRESDFRSFPYDSVHHSAAAGGGKDATVTFETADPANDHAWGIDNSTPDTPPGVKSDSTPV